MDPWRAEIKTLSEFPNVWCKISGLVTEADHRHWTREQLKPYIDHVIECFGFDRVMYGGDWPVAFPGDRSIRAGCRRLPGRSKDAQMRS